MTRIALKQMQSIRVLLIEDSEFDAVLLLRHLQSHGYQTQSMRIASKPEMEEALEREWDLVLCDYQMPHFDVLTALSMLRHAKLDLPFIIVSGAIGEELAVDLMRSGAHDFIVKGRLSRLIPAIERERREAKARTERSAALEKLSYLAAIVDSTEEAIVGQNMEGLITTWNSGATRLYGYTPEEAAGKPSLMLVPQELHRQAAEVVQKLRRAESAGPMESIRTRKNGETVCVCVTMSPIKDSSGHVIGASSIAYDITERKKAEAEKTELIAHLNDSLSKVKTLSGLLPICAQCKKIRDDHGYWQRLEHYVREHSCAEFSHSICPDCMTLLYPEFAARIVTPESSQRA